MWVLEIILFNFVMRVYVCAEENNFLNFCSIYFVSGDRRIYVRLLL